MERLNAELDRKENELSEAKENAHRASLEKYKVYYLVIIVQFRRDSSFFVFAMYWEFDLLQW